MLHSFVFKCMQCKLDQYNSFDWTWAMGWKKILRNPVGFYFRFIILSYPISRMVDPLQLHPLWCYSVLKRGREQENKMMQLKKWKLCLEIPIFSPFSPIYVHFLIGFYAWPNPKWEGQRCIIVVKAFSQCEKEGEKKMEQGKKVLLLLPEVVVL